jgi:hypothetical protein
VAAGSLLVSLGCSSGTDTGAPSSTVGVSGSELGERVRPEGPSAALQELTGGSGPFVAAAGGPDLDEADYVEEEFVASGVATSYRDPELRGDGRWSFEPDDEAPFRTRVLVRRPADADRSSGVVLLEWLNVSSGLDANPDWTVLEEEILREGHTWVGVSAQRTGVEGGPVLVTAPGAEALAGKGLVALDPERYGELEHPGDGYSFDIFTQVARAARAGGPLTGGEPPELLLAVGESQSAIALTTYHNGVQPLSDAFDGFFVHSRAAVALPLVGPGESADLAGSIGGEVVRFRDDLDVPVMNLQAEGDVVGVLGSAAARQNDTERFRLWEVAGTAHADAHLLGPLAGSADCGVAINDGPLHVVAKAALHHLVGWARDGTEPPRFDRLELTDGTPPAIARDADGIAVGGVRTPATDVPVVALSGDPGPSPDLFCLLLGSTVPLPPERLQERYGSSTAYRARFDEALEAAVRSGAVLPADRDAMAAYADPSRIPG